MNKFSKLFGKLNVSTGGLRGEKELSPTQINDAVDYAVSLNMPRTRIKYSNTFNVSYGEIFDVLYLGTDTYPVENAEQSEKQIKQTKQTKGTTGANSRISWKGSVAHEIVGHREAKLKGLTQKNYLLEEVQASIRAARFAPGLSDIERITLLRDAVYRLHKNNIKVNDVKHLLNIKER